MALDERNKRDLPEVVADILIEQQMRRDINELKQEVTSLGQRMDDGFNRMEHAFNAMTTAVLDAMNRQTDRYDRTADAQQ